MNADVPLMAFSESLPGGGSTTFLVNLAREFKAAGLSLPIVSLSDHYTHREDFEAVQADVTFLAESGRLIFEDRLAWGYEQARKHQPRALLACLSSGSFEILRYMPPGVLRFGIIQSDDPGPYEMPRLYHPWLDVMVGVSEQICTKLRAMPECQRLRVECIPYGIHFDVSPPRIPRRAEEPLRIVYVGRIIETQKRISRLAGLINMAAERGLNWEFTVVGAGPEEQSFRSSLKPNVRAKLLGNIPNREMAALLRGQDVFVLLSDFEGLPLSLLEAMGEGVVPVISDLESGIRDVVTSDCGIRVPVGDVNAACVAIASLADDRARLAQLSAASSQKARQEYSSARMAMRYRNLITEACASRSTISWPEKITIPAPLGLSPVMFAGWPRRARRLIKKIKR